MRVRTVSLTVLTVALALTTIGRATTTSAASSHALPAQHPAGFVPNSTQAVCALTGDHGNVYKEEPTDYTDSKYGLSAGDSGSSFEYNGQVWWLFGNTDAYQSAPWGKSNEKSRWPDDVKPFNSAAAQGSDSIAWSSEATPPPFPAVPYTGTTPAPNQQCPILNFVTRPEPPLHVGSGPPEPYINPSVFPDPYFTTPPHVTATKYYVSLRRGELPEAGISEGGKMYVVFGTDNPANCQLDTTMLPGPCVSNGDTAPCGPGSKGSRTRSVMAVYLSDGRFQGLYDLSTPLTRFAPLCATTSWSQDDARFVNVQMQNGNDGFIYIWGTEGGSNDSLSPVFLAKIPAGSIATGAGIQYWNGTIFVPPGKQPNPQSVAQPLFLDFPNSCASQLGIQYNQYLNEWIMLYRCDEDPAPKGHPNGIYMRTAPNPQGPWSAPTTIFNPASNEQTRSGLCYFIYDANTKFCLTQKHSDDGVDDDSKTKPRPGGDYGPYIVANWTTGSLATDITQARSTIYYTLDTFDPYGQMIMRSTILGPPAAPLCTKNCG